MNQRYSTQRFQDLDQDYQPQALSFDDEGDFPAQPPLTRLDQPGFIGGLMRRPVMTMVLLATLGLTAGALVMKFYPATPPAPGDLPVIKAETTPFRQAPDSPGGMNIPGTDSALFDVVDGQTAENPTPAAANPAEASAGTTEQSSDSLESYTQQAQGAVSETMQAPAEPATTAQASTDSSQPDLLVPAQKPEAIVAETASTLPDTLASNTASNTASNKTAETAMSASNPAAAPSQASLQPPAEKDTSETTVAPAALASAKTESAPPAQQQQALLEQVPPSPEAANAVEPAAGAAKPSAFSVMPGDYYIQLSSVTSESGAQTEWTKLRKDYGPVLTEAPHRIKRVDLGERGIYFRVQAGPMNRESAKRLCDAIKTQKPSGCLIVQ